LDASQINLSTTDGDDALTVERRFPEELRASSRAAVTRCHDGIGFGIVPRRS
jgi:hypothetical protein